MLKKQQQQQQDGVIDIQRACLPGWLLSNELLHRFSLGHDVDDVEFVNITSQWQLQNALERKYILTECQFSTSLLFVYKRTYLC